MLVLYYSFHHILSVFFSILYSYLESLLFVDMVHTSACLCLHLDPARNTIPWGTAKEHLETTPHVAKNGLGLVAAGKPPGER